MKILDYDGFKQVITKIKTLIDKKAEKTDLEKLKTTVDKKVDAVSGKGFSTNDYTNAEKNKLSSIPENLKIPKPPLPITDLKAKIVGNKVHLTWTNPIDDKYAGVKIIKTLGNTPTSISDGTQVYSGNGNNCYDNLGSGGIVSYRGFAFNRDSDYNSDLGQSTKISIQVDDKVQSPGNWQLLKGTMKQGWFGEVSSSNFISGDELARKVGITAGTSQNSDCGWLKFAYMGKVEFVAKKPIRYGISWNSINNADAVTGQKTIEIGGKNYKIRLMKGKTEGKQNDSSSYNGAINKSSEWNKLMLPIHQKAPSNWAYKDNVNDPTENWNVGYTNNDLFTHYKAGNGTYTWCQECGNSSANRLVRGNYDVSYAGSDYPSYADNAYGWRPVLELVR